MPISERLADTVDLRANQRVLDVATGTGNTAIAAARRLTSVTGMDYAPSLLERAREIVTETLEQSSDEEKADYGVIKEKIRADLKRYISKQTQRRPLIMPVILEI